MLSAVPTGPSHRMHTNGRAQRGGEGARSALLLSALTALFAGVLAAVMAAQPSAAQTTPLVIPYDIPHVRDGSVDFGDLDGDGDLDLAVTGRDDRELIVRVLRLMNVTHFRGETLLKPAKNYFEVSFSGRPAVHGGVRWGDYDGDGDDDLLVTGLTRFFAGGLEHSVPVLDVYRNVGPHGMNAWFDEAIQLEGLHRSSVDWGDFDGDGDLDIVASGLPSTDAQEPVTWVFVNHGDGTFIRVDTNLPGTISGDVAWGDYDGDGLADLALMGDTGRGVFVSRVYRNTGGGFVDSGLLMPGLAFGSVDWGDLDGDGDPDLLLTGGRLDPRLLRGVTKVYRNDGGRLAEAPVELEGWTLGQARWGDADRDGDMDLYVLGAPTALGRSNLTVLAYNGAAFTKLWELDGTRFGALAVDDYNGDGDADVAILGRLTGDPLFRFFSNRAHPECLLADWIPPGTPQGDCL